jgi:alkylation response protein AidB-like acyl-CoA dehydrogenase
MYFNWDQHHKKLYEQILEFSQTHLKELLLEPVHQHFFPYSQWQKCGELGLLGLSVAQEYGGRGLDALTTARVEEALGKGCENLGFVFSVAAHLFACVMPIYEYGSEEIKQAYLPGLCSGKWIGANAMTEAEAGSDISHLKTLAIREGDEYILNGTKSYVSNAPIADIFMVYATTNPSHGHMGISAFIIERNTPGLIIGEPVEKMGLNTSLISPVQFENCRINIKQRIGEEGKGTTIFTKSMQWERSGLFATYLGMMERQLERTIAHASARKQFRKAVSKNQAVSHKIVDMKLRLEAARLLTYKACSSMDQNEDATLDISLAKLAVSEAAIQSSIDAIQIHGGIGYLIETGIEQMLRDSIPATIFSGTSEIQRDLIARKLGL